MHVPRHQVVRRGVPLTGEISISGLSWFGVLPIARFLSALRYSHAQPLPNRVLAAVLNASLNLSNDPKLLLIAADNSDEGPADPVRKIIPEE